MSSPEARPDDVLPASPTTNNASMTDDELKRLLEADAESMSSEQWDKMQQDLLAHFVAKPPDHHTYLPWVPTELLYAAKSRILELEKRCTEQALELECLRAPAESPDAAKEGDALARLLAATRDLKPERWATVGRILATRASQEYRAQQKNPDQVAASIDEALKHLMKCIDKITPEMEAITGPKGPTADHCVAFLRTAFCADDACAASAEAVRRVAEMRDYVAKNA